VKYLKILIYFSLVILNNTYSISQENKLDKKAATFKGKIGEFPIRMDLNYINGEVLGWYDYPGLSTKLRIEGSIDENKKVELKEFDYKARQTGEFHGDLIDNNKIVGSWNNINQSKNLPFILNLTNKNQFISEQLTDGEVKTKFRKIYQPSKIKGFSKLALGVAIGLVLVLVFSIYYLLKSKRKALEKQKQLFEHTKKEHYQDVHVEPQKTTDKKSSRIGYEFEKFVVDLFSEQFYKLKFWTSDKSSNKNVSAENNIYPDLLIQFKYKENTRNFAVECKYRSNLINNAFTFEERQLENYRQFERENNVQVFIIIGVAGSPNSPKDFFIIPLKEIQSPIVSLEKLKLWKFPLSENREFFYNYDNETLRIWNKKQNTTH
jgi:hypothetical protein